MRRNPWPWAAVEPQEATFGECEWECVGVMECGGGKEDEMAGDGPGGTIDWRKGKEKGKGEKQKAKRPLFYVPRFSFLLRFPPAALFVLFLDLTNQTNRRNERHCSWTMRTNQSLFPLCNPVLICSHLLHPLARSSLSPLFFASLNSARSLVPCPIGRMQVPSRSNIQTKKESSAISPLSSPNFPTLW